MSVTYNTAVKTDRMHSTCDYFASGTLEILSAADVVLAIFHLAYDGGSVTGAVWTLDFLSTTVTGESGASGGTVATKAQIKNSAGAAHLTGLTVGLSATDVIVNNTSIASGQNLTMNSATVTHAA
jgi:hypothetical protein